jgi:hypothetical protein
VTGWLYRVEFLQALFLLVFPGDAGRRFDGDDGAASSGARDTRMSRGNLRLHRIYVQMLGVVFIFLTAFWGMYTNVTVGPLG